MSEQKVLLFGGTTEGRELAAWLRENNISALSHVATEYGEALLREEALPAEAGRLNEGEMRELLQTGVFSAVVDATHPFATEVSRNIREAAEEAGVFYCRVLRAAAEESEARTCCRVNGDVRILNGISYDRVRIACRVPRRCTVV